MLFLIHLLLTYNVDIEKKRNPYHKTKIYSLSNSIGVAEYLKEANIRQVFAIHNYMYDNAEIVEKTLIAFMKVWEGTDFNTEDYLLYYSYSREKGLGLTIKPKDISNESLSDL